MESVTDRVPLLTSLEDTTRDSEEFKDDFEVLFSIPRRSEDLYRRADHDNNIIKSSGGGGEVGVVPRRKKKQYSGSEMIVAVFVVAFDTKKGNIVEWKYPPEVVLENIEFKSMASGLHTITTDFIYFKHNQLYGLSCYEKIPVDNQEERGARMKSVGLLAVGYYDLHLHMEFLQRQVRSQVETPGDYGSLEEYFRHYRNPKLSSPSSIHGSAHGLISEPTLNMQYPEGCFTKFLTYFGPYVFVLWKLALLKKRVLLFSQPPVGVVCHKVYCTCLLPCHALPLDLDTECNPQFYVNVSDIDHLQSLDSYIACTTERIFQSKTRLYDVYVDGQSFQSSSEELRYLIRPTPLDERRYAHLNNIRSSHLSQGGRDDLMFANYFLELSSQLFRILLDAASSEDKVLTVDMVEGIHLDPLRDRYFLIELASLYKPGVTLQRQADVFTCCL